MRFHRDYSTVKVDDVVWCTPINHHRLDPSQPPKLGVVTAGWVPARGDRYINGWPLEQYYIGDVVPVPTIELD